MARGTAGDPDALDDLLRARGLRVTPQRRLVADAVDTLGHSTPEQICERVQQELPSMNLSTVYRTLELLEDLELVSHTHLGHGAPIYHAAHEREHLHLVCGSCGRVLESPSECASTMIAQLRADFGFETDIAHFALYGRCAECRVSSDDASGRPGNNELGLEG